MIRKIIALSIVFLAVLSAVSLTGCKKDPTETDTDKVKTVVEDGIDNAKKAIDDVKVKD